MFSMNPLTHTKRGISIYDLRDFYISSCSHEGLCGPSLPLNFPPPGSYQGLERKPISHQIVGSVLVRVWRYDLVIKGLVRQGCHLWQVPRHSLKPDIFRVLVPQFSRFCHLLALRPQTSYLVDVSFCCCINKMGIMIETLFLRVLVGI